MTDEGAQITVCQGPPRCLLAGEEAEAAQQAGCPWCEVITITADGREFRRGPSDDAEPRLRLVGPPFRL